MKCNMQYIFICQHIIHTFFKEMLLYFPESLPRKYIPYLIKTYADGEINYMCYRRYYGIPEDTPKRGYNEDEEFEEY